MNPMDPEATDWSEVVRLVDELWTLPDAEREERMRRLAESDPAVWAQARKLLEADARPPGFLRAAGGLDFALELDESVPEQLGPWSIRGELGRGGMGRVYEAERADGRFERRVALKVLSSSMPSADARRRFEEEVRLLARLEHPNIARLYDAGVDDGVSYLVMELVEGSRIDDYCDAEGMDANERIILFESVCEAVQHAHQNLVVHRDLKPSNILVAPDGCAKLLDFGIAKLQADSTGQVGEAGGVAMTPAYASPEQRRGGPVAAATDVYSLGVILYELVTGRRPLRPDNAADSSDRGGSVPPGGSGEVGVVVPDASGWTETATPTAAHSLAYTSLAERDRGDLDAILEKALGADPADRYPSVQGLLEDLRRFRAMLPVSARAQSRGYRIERFVARHRAAVAAAAVIGVLLVGAVATALWQGRVAAIERDTAEREAARAEEVTAFLTSVFETTAPWQGGVADDVAARELLDRGARRVETDLAGDPLLQAEMMLVLGQVYRGLSIDDEAERLLEGALERRVGLLGTDHAETVEAMLALAGFQSTRYSREADHIEKAVELYERAVTVTRDDRAQRLLLGRALTGLGAMHLLAVGAPIDAERSETLLTEALAIAEELENDDLLGSTSHYLGWWHMNAGSPEEASRLYEAALEARTTAWGPMSPSALSTAHQIGWFYEGIGRYDEAAAYFERALDARRRIYGPDHPRSASTATGLAAVRIGQGRHAEAEALLVDALPTMERFAADTTLASARGWLARALAGQGRVEAASAEFEWAIEHGEASRTVRVVNDYAVHLHAMGRLAEAEVMYRQALEAYRSDVGSDHPFTAVVAGNLAAVVGAQGRHEEAATLLEDAIAVLERANGPDHATVGNALRDLGWTRLLQGRMDLAEPQLDRAHAILLASYGPEHWRTAVAKLYLGVGYRVLERVEDAEEILLESHRLLEPHREARPDDWYWVNAHLAALYAGLGRDEDAARYRVAVGG